MHIDNLDKAMDAVISRAERGESLTNDDLIIKAAGTQIRGAAVRIDYARARGERPYVAMLNGNPVTDAASTLAKRGASLKMARAA